MLYFMVQNRPFSSRVFFKAVKGRVGFSWVSMSNKGRPRPRPRPCPGRPRRSSLPEGLDDDVLQYHPQKSKASILMTVAAPPQVPRSAGSFLAAQPKKLPAKSKEGGLNSVLTSFHISRDESNFVARIINDHILILLL